MTESRSTRRPQVFEIDDPDLVIATEPSPEEQPGAPPRAGTGGASIGLDDARRGIRWGAILLTATSALASLALALSFARFVSIAFERNDAIGWLAFGLLAVGVVAAIMLVAREAVGFLRLRRLGKIRADADLAIAARDFALEKHTADRILSPLKRRPDCAWALARISEAGRDVHDPGDLLRLVDRHLMMPLDGNARRVVASAARRIGTVSAISPTALLTVVWVLVENLRMLRQIASLYGGRPGFVATARLARMVLAHIVATGGIAMTDDLLGQFLGQDLLRRLSRRLGESVFNAALTARVGAAAIEVIRPLPYLEAPPVRARDFISEIARRQKSSAAAATGKGAPDAAP